MLRPSVAPGSLARVHSMTSQPRVEGALVEVVSEHARGIWLCKFCHDVSGDLFALRESNLQVVRDNISQYEAMNLQLQKNVNGACLMDVAHDPGGGGGNLQLFRLRLAMSEL